MKLWLDSISIHALGEVSLMSQASENGGLKLPNKETRTLVLQLETWEQSYKLNTAAITAARNSLAKGYVTLLIQDDDGTEYLNRPVIVASHNLPEDPNAWGTYQQRLTITVTYQVNLSTASTHLELEFTDTDSSADFTLGHVTVWRPEWNTTRFHPMRDIRESVRSVIHAEGEWLANPNDTLDAQRTWLEARIAEWSTALNGKSGDLSYGGFFDRTVRVDSFAAEVNQGVNGIVWRMAFSYTVHPDEADYATAEFTVEKDEDFAETSNAILTISGKVAANDKAAAVTKLATLRNAILSDAGFLYAVLDKRQLWDKNIDCDDGTAFLEINFTEAYRDLADGADRLPIAFTKTGTGSSINLGHVEKVERAYKSQRFMELKNLRERAGGMVVISGEYVANRADSVTVRRVDMLARIEEWETAVNGKDGRLTYGPPSNRFFNKLVRVDDFRATIDKAVTRIKWQLQASYTLFPDEDGYATAQFKAAISLDRESGDQMLTLSGKVEATTEIVARAKLELLRPSALAANGFAAGKLLNSQIEPSYIDCDDGTSNSVFTFTETYRQRASNILSFKVNVVPGDIDVKSGLSGLTYSGSVTASGADADAAYAAALTKALALGANKHTFLDRSRITRSDRQVGESELPDFVTLEFTFEYRVKGTRIYMEVSASTEEAVFGEKVLRVSGFVVASDNTVARAAYLAQVRDAYNGQAVRNESTVDARHKVEQGSYSGEATWAGLGSYAELQIRLDFSFEVYQAKTVGAYSIKYGFKVKLDYVNLVRRVTVQGRFFGGAAMIAAAEAGTGGNKLDALLTSLVGSAKHLDSERDSTRERYGDALEHVTGLDFTDNYESPLTSEAAVINCSLDEDMVYSGTRWQFKALPDGVSIPQDCGIKEGSRTVSGSVTAPTETACMTWVTKCRALPFYDGTGGGDEPSSRYHEPPRIRKRWTFLQLTDGVGRGDGANSSVCTVEFTFSETLPEFEYVEV
jgi:hypothetical protein